ncbi:hypothetical protein RFI_08280 [Reticulomyxa filosa]|uniref:Uncharacterized protein n=1 Tax=Reticulomyxa filosa TaxID=46433 RepID=X6NSD3_RETFI|nr:hypothetical protein RFI_08280 [Reticulomyxa filosa]|eukprot:ETO28848.1 hypothetical protein RFI_08280 [Reticulomyxa filosa]
MESIPEEIAINDFKISDTVLEKSPPAPQANTSSLKELLQSKEDPDVPDLSDEKKNEIRNFLMKQSSAGNIQDNVSQTSDENRKRGPYRKKVMPRTNMMKTDDTQMIRKAKILTVEGYLKSERFGPFLCQNIGIAPEQVRLLDIPQLEDVHQEIKCLITKRYKERFVEGLSKIGLKTLESAISPFYNIAGFESILMANQEFLDCLEELKLEIQGPPLPLSMRMGMCMAQTAIICNQLNSLNGENFQINPESFHHKFQPKREPEPYEQDDDEPKNPNQTI